MKISPKEIIETIESKIDTVLDGLVVAKDYVYTNDQIDTDGRKDYPRVYYWWNDAGALADNHNTMVMGFIFCDVMGGKTNSLKRDYEIKSDMVQAASKLFDNLSRDPLFPSFNQSISYDPFAGRFSNDLSGIQLTVTFAIEKPCYNV